MSLLIVKYGTPIITKIGNIKALITATCIRDQAITYEISYFQNGVSTTCWIHRIEFDIDVSENKPAGLVNYDLNKNEETLLITD